MSLYFKSIKSRLDVSLALILLVILSPFFISIILILSFSQGGVFFKHERIGLNGKTFYLLKFRTMVENSDEELHELLQKDEFLRKEWKTTRKLTNDPRITPIGRILRKAHIDELPQLINVLKGEMSLVGPRPITLEEFNLYFSKESTKLIYQSLKPGITGIWTTNGYDGMLYSDRINMELTYLDQINFRTDIKVIIKSVNAIIRRKGR